MIVLQNFQTWVESAEPEQDLQQLWEEDKPLSM